MSSKKTILVTGTSAGFGRLTAESLARKGHTVFATMRNTSSSNAKFRDAFRTLAKREGLDLHVSDLDVTDSASVDRAVDEIVRQKGHIDVLVNNAGVVSYGLIEAFTLEQVQQMFDVNLFGSVRMNRAVLPHMRKRGKGLLVHLSSGLGRVVFPIMGVYSASKFALEALAETYRYELASTGVDSVIVEPGVYPTNMPGSTGRAADTARSADYGPLAALADQLPAQFVESAKDRDANEVADAIVGLIEMAPGTRPLRTCVGEEAQGAKTLNETAAQIQGGLFETFGMPEMAKLST